MFNTNLYLFLKYIRIELAPKIHQLESIYNKYKFESPLNFIMVKSDFKRFYESFVEAKLSLFYSLEMHKDSMFALRTEQPKIVVSAEGSDR